MIPRYSRNILKEIWEDNNKFQIWLDLEILACEAMEKLGRILGYTGTYHNGRGQHYYGAFPDNIHEFGDLLAGIKTILSKPSASQMV